MSADLVYLQSPNTTATPARLRGSVQLVLSEWLPAIQIKRFSLSADSFQQLSKGLGHLEMLSWFKGLFSKPQLPAELQRMLDITVQHAEHPLVKTHLRQVSILGLYYPDGRYIPMYLPEFRDGLFAALFWDDVDGVWGSGGWIPVAHENADVTCEPTYFNWDYLTNTPGFDSPKEVMDYLYQTRPSARSTKEER